ncbi:MAG: hypothetical protein E7385_08765 [Ruminococcaceae bacterium]|nr:hypothetical protein [Oscillospiraceae bacterium]
MINSEKSKNKLPEFQIKLKNQTNIKMCEPFRIECLRLAKLAEKYKEKISELYNTIAKCVIREECSVDGESLFRGFYHPSPIFDIVVGNCNRGRLLKRITKKSRVTFKYGFDKSNRLVIVESMFNLSNKIREFIIYNENTALGIGFDSENSICYLCEEVFENNKIMHLIRASYCAHENRISTLHKEDYIYDKYGLKIADIYMYYPDLPLVDHLHFDFQHDEEGYLSKYTSISFEGSVFQRSAWTGHEFEVKVKRKI